MVQMAWRYAGTTRRDMVLFYALFLIANIAISFQPIILAKIINLVQASGLNVAQQLLPWAFLYGAVIVLFWSLHGPARVIERRSGFTIYHAFTADLYRKVTEMPLKWHQDHHSGDTINRLNKASHALFNFAQEQFSIIQMTVRFVMGMILLGTYSLGVLAASLFVSICVALVIRRFDKILVPLIERTNEGEHHLNATLFDYISNIITILTLRVQGNTCAGVDQRIQTIKPIFWEEFVINEWKWGVVNMVLVISQIGIVSAYILYRLESHETLVIGSVVAIFQYLLIISQVFYDAAQVYSRLMQRYTDVHSVDVLVDDHARVGASALLEDQRMWKVVTLDHLSFTHHEGEDVLHHLRDVGLDIKAGQKIALVGSSGSGKTTLLTLLRGLYDSQKVNVTIDGKGYQTLAPLARFTTLVPQDSEIFENTVLYNLTLGTEVPDAMVEQALHITTFDQVTPQLPNGLDTDIRERGVNLSGGQKQRLALSRGLIAARDSSLLLLDEPTSSVDLQTESIIFDRMLEAFPNKAIVASIHRLHLLPRFDWIGLMRDGQMIEQGTFQDLLTRGGAFKAMWKHHLAQSGALEVDQGSEV